MSDDLKKAQLRANQYQHIDGTYELTFGVTFLLMAASFWGISRTGNTNDFLVNNIYPWIPLVVFAGGGFLIDSLVKRFRLRVTARRSGYMEGRKPQPLKRSTRRIIWIGVPVLTVFLLAVMSLNRGKFQSSGQDSIFLLLPPFMGLIFGGLWLIAGWKLALPRFYLIAVVSLAMAVFLFLNGVGGNPGMAVFLAAMGLAITLTGGITLWRYLARTTEQEVEK
jgi:hypothetical protein